MPVSLPSPLNNCLLPRLQEVPIMAFVSRAETVAVALRGHSVLGPHHLQHAGPAAQTRPGTGFQFEPGPSCWDLGNWEHREDS